MMTRFSDAWAYMTVMCEWVKYQSNTVMGKFALIIDDQIPSRWKYWYSQCNHKILILNRREMYLEKNVVDVFELFECILQILFLSTFLNYIDGPVQDCSLSTANALGYCSLALSQRYKCHSGNRLKLPEFCGHHSINMVESTWDRC